MIFAAKTAQPASGLLELPVAFTIRAGYFEGHMRRLQYQELREEGWPIGSGMVESACKQYRHRFVGTGMRWIRPGIERLLPVRSAIRCRRFHEVWSSVYKPPRI